MSRLEQLRQRWRESTDNTDNWDRERFNRERISALRLITAYGLIWATFSTIISYVMEVRPSSAPMPFGIPLLFVILLGLMLFLDTGMGREYRKRFENEEGTPT